MFDDLELGQGVQELQDLVVREEILQFVPTRSGLMQGLASLEMF